MALKTFVKHERFMDVCCEIIAIGPQGRLLVEWWNMGQLASHKINEISHIYIDEAEAHKWYWAQGNTKQFLRELEWEKMA